MTTFFIKLSSQVRLLTDHIFGRTITADLVKSADAYQKGDKVALPLITYNLRKFADLYPKHIEKEDKVFFPASMTYFSEPERESMLDEFWEFDRKMIHAKYKSIIESLER